MNMAKTTGMFRLVDPVELDVNTVATTTGMSQQLFALMSHIRWAGQLQHILYLETSWYTLGREISLKGNSLSQLWWAGTERHTFLFAL